MPSAMRYTKKFDVVLDESMEIPKTVGKERYLGRRPKRKTQKTRQRQPRPGPRGGHTIAKKGRKHQDQDPDGKHPASQTERFTFHLLAAGSWGGALSLTLGFGVGSQLG